MSKSRWDQLSPEDQEIIREAAKDSVSVQRELWAAAEEAAMEEVRANGRYASTPELQH